MPNEQFVSVRGQKLFVREHGAGPPLLLVHGFPLDHTMWSGQIDALAARHRVFAIDLPGFGKSELALESPKAPLTMERLADDVALALDALGVTERIIFCSLSMGGYVAWQFWKRHGQRLDRLILCDTRAVGDSPEAAQSRRELAGRVLQEGAEAVAKSMTPKLFSEETARKRPELVELTRQTMLATPVATLAAALLGMAVREDMRAELAAIDVPALVVCGEHDVISPLAEMREIAAAMPRATFEAITGAGHMAPLESPEAVNQAIDRFLRR